MSILWLHVAMLGLRSHHWLLLVWGSCKLRVWPLRPGRRPKVLHRGCRRGRCRMHAVAHVLGSIARLPINWLSITWTCSRERFVVIVSAV
jgi:hypothetical protein